MVAIPVDRMTEHLRRAISSSIGALVRSPEPTLSSLQAEAVGKQIEAQMVERRRQEPDAALAAVLDQPPMRGIVEFERLEHIELARGIAGVADLVVRFLGGPRDQLIGLEGLELDDVGAGIGGGIDQRDRHVEFAVMIDPGLGDDRYRCHRRPLHGVPERAHRPFAIHQAFIPSTADDGRLTIRASSASASVRSMRGQSLIHRQAMHPGPDRPAQQTAGMAFFEEVVALRGVGGVEHHGHQPIVAFAIVGIDEDRGAGHVGKGVDIALRELRAWPR